MADALPESTLATLDDPFAQLSGPLASTTRLDLQVVDSARLTPHMQRLRLTAPQLDRFAYLPGQDVMLLVAAQGNRPVRRRYTIRELDRAARLLTLDIVLHGDGPGERWVRSAQPGDRIEGIGPRGKITTSATAGWHLFMGDEPGVRDHVMLPPIQVADSGRLAARPLTWATARRSSILTWPQRSAPARNRRGFFWSVVEAVLNGDPPFMRLFERPR